MRRSSEPSRWRWQPQKAAAGEPGGWFLGLNADRWSRRVLVKIIPHDACSIYKFELTYGHLALLVAGVVSLFAAFFTEHVVQMRAEEAKVRELQRVTVAQQQQLVNFSNQTNHLWNTLNQIQQDNRLIQRLTASAPDASNAQTRQQSLQAATPLPPLSDALPLHGPWWTQATAWLGLGRGGVTFAAMSDELTMLDAGLERVYSDTLKRKHEAGHVAQLRLEAKLAYQRMLEAIPSIWPTDGSISSGFGYRTYPDVGFHTGVDIVNYYGAPIVATAAGTVVEAGWDYGYGIKIVIDHGNGYETWYGHNSEALVSAGQFVHKGQLIARLGATGFVTGPHVHYEVHEDGRPLNPIPFLSGSIGPSAQMLAQIH